MGTSVFLCCCFEPVCNFSALLLFYFSHDKRERWLYNGWWTQPFLLRGNCQSRRWFVLYYFYCVANVVVYLIYSLRTVFYSRKHYETRQRSHRANQRAIPHWTVAESTRFRKSSHFYSIHVLNLLGNIISRVGNNFPWRRIGETRRGSIRSHLRRRKGTSRGKLSVFHALRKVFTFSGSISNGWTWRENRQYKREDSEQRCCCQGDDQVCTSFFHFNNVCNPLSTIIPETSNN